MVRQIRSRLLLVASAMAAVVFAVGGAPGAVAGNGADGSTYVLTSFDGTSLLGLNDQGHTFTAQIGAATNFKEADLSKYSPTDPYKAACGTAAAAYNAALIVATSDGGVALDSALTSLASLACKARVILNPSDPYVPPNPIKSLQPVA